MQSFYAARAGSILFNSRLLIASNTACLIGVGSVIEHNERFHRTARYAE